jgi:hypothetical protein
LTGLRVGGSELRQRRFKFEPESSSSAIATGSAWTDRDRDGESDLSRYFKLQGLRWSTRFLTVVQDGECGLSLRLRLDLDLIGDWSRRVKCNHCARTVSTDSSSEELRRPRLNHAIRVDWTALRPLTRLRNDEYGFCTWFRKQ